MTREFENELIRSVLRGNVNAFEPLVTEYQKTVYNLALRMCGSAEDAEDITQETFLKAYKSLSAFRGESRFSVWLYRIASNVCTDHLRAGSGRDTVSMTADDDTEYDVPDETNTPERAFERRLIRQSVSAGLASLSPKMREILLLREINGMSYAEIAQTLGLDEGTVKSRIFRARKKLCEFLLREGNIPDGVSSENTEGGAER